MSGASPPPSDGFKFRWDVLVFLVFVLTCAPSFTGIPLHEWASIGLVALLVIHLLSNWNWIVEVSRRAGHRLGAEIRFNHILDSLLFVSFTLLMVSGLMVSESALPTLGLPARSDAFWRMLHVTSANVFPSLVAVHLAMHARWIVSRLRRRPADRVVNPMAR